MTRVVVTCVSRDRRSPLQEATLDYERRIDHYMKFESICVPPARLPDNRAKEIRRKEAEILTRRMPKELAVVALTRTGVSWSTADMARFLGELSDWGKPGVCFVVGGAHGLSQAFLDTARLRVAISAMTLPHEMARLMVTEQIYRAATMLRGESYHKGS